MNNHVVKINGQHTLFHRSTRKIVWFLLPTLQPINKYYTKSAFINLNKDGNMIVADQGSISFVTIKLPPLTLCQYRKQFIEYDPMGGFSLSHTLVLYEKHSIAFFSNFPTFSKHFTIEVVQEINNVQCSLDETVIGVMVKQKKNTIYIWDLSQFSNKPRQEIEVTDQIIKWQFHEKQMLFIMTKTHLRVFYPRENHYNIQFYCEIPCDPIDFCLLDRPKTNQHTGRRTVYPIAILSKNKRLFIYELFDIDKRVKTSIAHLLVDLEVDRNIERVISGFEKNNEVLLVFEHMNKKPIVYTLNEKFEVIERHYYLPEISDTIKSIEYKSGYALVESGVSSQENDGKIWQVFEHSRREECKLISGFDSKQAVLGDRKLYLFSDSTLSYYSKQRQFSIAEKNIQFKCPSNIKLLEEIQNHTFFISGIRVYRLDLLDSQIKVAGFIVKNERFKLVEVRTHTRSLLYSVGNQYYLIEYKVENQKIVSKNIRASPNKMISLRNGKWAQLSNISIAIGKDQRKLTSFDLIKFFKNISSNNNLLYDYKLYWTTHDGIIMIAKNYLFVFQLIQGAEGFSLSLIKRSLTYLHHRFSPDAQVIEVLDPREITVREGNRIIKLGSKLGYYVSQNPYSLPDTLLSRQLAMKKHVPPHHPKIILHLIQLGSFSHISKLIMSLYQWYGSEKPIESLYQQLDADFFNTYEQKDDQRIIVSKMEEQEETEIEKMKKLCEHIFEDPQRLKLEENNALILQSQIESLIFKEENSRSLDYYSSITITQNKIESVKNKIKSFQSMQIAYMLHSINKDEAIALLKPEKIDWGWFKRYSIVMWFDNKQQIKKWIEELGGLEYRKNKDAFDCLLWYLLVGGKMNLLISLFKACQHHSDKHKGVYNFLQKDFNNPKTLSSAQANAFKLIKNKDYYLSIAFFLLAKQVQFAVSTALSKLKDINLAFLLCLLFDYPMKDIYRQLEDEGDVWCKHISKYYQSAHIDSFNCLFQEDNYQKMDQWQMEPKLTKFHPCLKHFAEMIEKSIPVKRQLEEQRLRKESKNNQSMDIFESFYGQNQSETNVEETLIQDKQLLPNYEWISEKSAQFFLQDQCPELALMIDHNNYRAQRAYDLSRFMISKKVKPTVLEIAEEIEDTLCIITSKIENGHSVYGLLRQHYEKTINSFKTLFLIDIILPDKHIVGAVLHFCYLTDKILGKQKQILQNQTSTECLLFFEEKLKLAELYGRLLIILQLKQYKLLQKIVEELILYTEKKMYLPATEQFWETLKKVYDRLPEMKKNKNFQVLDDFEQTFYKYTFVKNKAECINCDFQVGMQGAWQTYLKQVILSSLSSIFAGKAEISKHLQKVLRRYNKFFEVWVQEDAKFHLNDQISLIFMSGPSAKLKLNYLPDFLEQNFEGVARSIYHLKQVNKKNELPLIKLQNKSKKIDSQTEKHKQAIEIFKNKSEGLQSFTINKNEGQGMEMLLLFKRGLKKFQVCQSLINRNRSQDGLYLVHEDTIYNEEYSVDFEHILQKNYPPLITETLKNIISNRKQYDGKGILKGSTKRGSSEYFKVLEGIPYINLNQMHVVKCHHFLPAFLLGGKGYIDICQFDTLNNYNKIKCPGMHDIIKLSSFEQRVTALDNNGSLSSFSFDHKISGVSVFSRHKANINDFCILSPTIYCYSTNNSIQIIDSLLHPNRQVVWKTSLRDQPLCIESLREKKIAVCRKNDLLFYDFRRDIQESSRQIAQNSNSMQSSSVTHNKAKCMVSDHKNNILIGKQDGKIRIINFDDKEKDFDIKCTKGMEESVQRDGKGLSVEEIEIMGNTAVVKTYEGAMYLIDKIQ